MRITAIVKEKYKYRVYLDESYAFSLYSKELVKYNIIEDNDISEKSIQDIMEVVIKRGVTYVYHLLSKKDYTRHEIYQKLLKVGVKEDNIESILNRFIQQGFVDDERYIKRYFENNHKQKSNKQMLYTLRNKGINIELINQVLSLEEVNEYETAKRIATKRLKGIVQPSYVEKIKLYRHLVNKGFKTDTIRSILGNLNTFNDE